MVFGTLRSTVKSSYLSYSFHLICFQCQVINFVTSFRAVKHHVVRQSYYYNYYTFFHFLISDNRKRIEKRCTM